MKMIICLMTLWMSISFCAQGQKLNPQGTWKIASIKIVKVPASASQGMDKQKVEQAKEDFIKESKKVSTITLNSDNTFESVGIEGTEYGTWKLDADGKTIYVERTKSKSKDTGKEIVYKQHMVDKLVLSSHTSDMLKGSLQNAEGAEAMVELQKAK
jgi:hypothetical protein